MQWAQSIWQSKNIIKFRNDLGIKILVSKTKYKRIPHTFGGQVKNTLAIKNNLKSHATTTAAKVICSERAHCPSCCHVPMRSVAWHDANVLATNASKRRGKDCFGTLALSSQAKPGLGTAFRSLLCSELSLHSGQSCSCTPVPLGSRTGTGPRSGPCQGVACEACAPSGRCPGHPQTVAAPVQCST